MPAGNGARVFITGCGGMLGKAVYDTFSPGCEVLATDIELNESWLEYADVRDLPRTREVVSDFDPGLIINLAALTDLEYCERHPEETWLTNALGAENMALIARGLDVPMIHISTAGVFDGGQEHYHEFDRPNPPGIHAKSKYYSESVVQRMLEKYFIFRAGWMMGGGPAKDKKFINKIYRQIEAGQNILRIVGDRSGTPTYTVDFARGMLEVAKTDYYGLYNMGSGGGCSRYDMAVEFVRLLKFEDLIRIEKVESEYFKNEYFAPRPRSEKIVNFKLAARGINFMRGWRECLAEYAEVFRGDLVKEDVEVTAIIEDSAL